MFTWETYPKADVFLVLSINFKRKQGLISQVIYIKIKWDFA